VALVLCTGTDDVLITTRKLILEQAGHQAVAARDESELLAACAEHEFDVAVIGQNVSANQKRRINAIVRAHCPESKVLELFSPSMGRILEDADDWLEVPADIPTDLPRRVYQLANRISK